MNKASTLALCCWSARRSSNFQAILGVFGTGAILGALVVIGAAFGLGYVPGDRALHGEVMGLGTAQRNIAAATVVATQSFDNANTVVMVSHLDCVDGAAVSGRRGPSQTRRQACRDFGRTGGLSRKAPWV